MLSFFSLAERLYFGFGKEKRKVQNIIHAIHCTPAFTKKHPRRIEGLSRLKRE